MSHLPIPISLTASVTGTLPAANGGSGATTLMGAGIPVVTSADLLAQSAAVSSIVAITAPNDAASHTYMVAGYIAITALTLATVTLQVSFTDENSNAQTLSFFGEGLTTAALSAVGFVGFPPMTIRVKVNTAVTIKTAAAITTSVVYDCGGAIIRIN